MLLKELSVSVYSAVTSRTQCTFTQDSLLGLFIMLQLDSAQPYSHRLGQLLHSVSKNDFGILIGLEQAATDVSEFCARDEKKPYASHSVHWPQSTRPHFWSSARTPQQ